MTFEMSGDWSEGGVSFGWGVRRSHIPGFWKVKVGRLIDGHIPNPYVRLRLRDRYKADDVGSAVARRMLEMFWVANREAKEAGT